MMFVHQSLTTSFFFLCYFYLSSLKSLIKPINGNGCFPPMYYETYTHHPLALSAGRARTNIDETETNLNTVKQQMQSSLLALPSNNVQENLDVIQMASDLNCHAFDSNCRWSNTDEDELDWKVLLAAPEAEPWINALQTTHLPDALSAVLLSGNRNTWDRGQLVSDLLPCIISPLQLTATVWRSSSNGPFQKQQPNLKICTRNIHVDHLYSNCILFPIQNGIPATVNVPEPRDPTTPAQIILMGDNFIAKNGGAIFVQDITVSGDLVSDCTTTTSFDTEHFNKPHRKQSKTMIPLHSFHDFTRNFIHASPSLVDYSLTAECLKLSCNPAERNCGWQKGIIGGWLSSTGAKNFSNPLTDIMVPPPAATNAFLVASFNHGDETKSSIRQMISPLINISTTELVHFCFYEYFALDGARFTMCTDQLSKRCFYSKINIPKNEHLQESRGWNLQCTELPFGVYKIYVSAENNGPNRGHIGFVPVRLSRNLDGTDPIC